MIKLNYNDCNNIIDKAIVFATTAHKGQTRKASITPAIIHSLEAASIASTMTDDENVIAAALLHDVVEDTKATLEEIEAEFGKRISYLVDSETENKREEISPDKTWIIRKVESINELKSYDDIDVKILWLSDKLSNMRSFYRLSVEKGNAMWDIFNQKDPKMHRWYYEEIANAVSELKSTFAYKEYIELIQNTFGGIINGN